MLAMFNRKKKTTPKPCAHQRSSAQTQKDGSPSKPSLADPPVSVQPLDEIHEPLEDRINDARSNEKISEKPISLTEIAETSIPCIVCKEEKRAARKYRWTLIAGLFLPFSLQALDSTIVASALPFIASDFRKSLLESPINVIV